MIDPIKSMKRILEAHKNVFFKLLLLYGLWQELTALTPSSQGQYHELGNQKKKLKEEEHVFDEHI